MTPTPDFSPAMLRLFLRARADLGMPEGATRRQRAAALRAFKMGIRKQAGVTSGQFDLAWMGRLQTPETRVRLWAVLGHFPGDFGIVLDYGGQEHVG